MSAAPLISVVIPCYNSGITIGHTLSSLEPWAGQPEVEVMVVDSSDDGTDTLIRDRFPWVRLHHCATRTFPGPARNLGAQQARGTWLAFTDADCVVAPNWIPAILDVIAGPPEWSACVGCVANHNPESAVGWVSFITEFNGYFGLQRRRPVKALPTFCTLLRKETFLLYGGFPEEEAWLEDMIFCAKLIEGGEALYLEPSLLVYHHNRSKLSVFLHHQFRLGQFFAHSRFSCNLPGARALRSSAASVPVLAAWRALHAYQRTLFGSGKAFLILCALTPLYALGVWKWMRGVWKGRRECVQENEN